MRANNMMTAISRLFGQDPQGKSRAMKTKPANDNAGLQPGGVGKTNNTLRCKGYAMHQESARICRKSRLLQLLLNKGPVSRHDLDELLGAENTPDLVMRLRRNNGFELPCERRPMIDGDGLPCLAGSYKLSDTDVPMARAFIKFSEHSWEFVAAKKQAESFRRAK